MTVVGSASTSGKPFHHLAKHAHLAPKFPAVVERLVRTVFPGRITPAQPVAIDEDDLAQHPPIINLGLAAALGKIWRKPHHLLVGQPVQALMLSLLTEPESHRPQPINGARA